MTRSQAMHKYEISVESHNGIEVSTMLFAERSRLFYALTAAEYIEMWSRGTFGADGAYCESEQRSGGHFRLELTRSSLPLIDITGSIETYLPFDRVHYLWEHTLFGRAGHSEVTITIRAGKARTFLKIAHAGTLTPDEQALFGSMWGNAVLWITRAFAREFRQRLVVSSPRVIPCC